MSNHPRAVGPRPARATVRSTESSTLSPTADRRSLPCLRTKAGSVFVDVLRTSTLRDIRSALLELAYVLCESDRGRPSRGDDFANASSFAGLVLTGSRLQEATLQEELAQFRAAMRTELRNRIFAVLAKDDGRIQSHQLPAGAPTRLPRFIMDTVKQHNNPAARRGRVSRQAVKALLLESYVSNQMDGGQMPSSIIDIQRACGASYPTVASALTELDAKRALSANRVHLIRPDLELWRSIASDHLAERYSKRFIDPTGLATRPERMLALLEKLRTRHTQEQADGYKMRFDLAISGVLGAKMLYPGLDVSEAMRLDLCIYDGDDSFVAELDPGLELTTDPHAKPVLVLHFTRNLRALCQYFSERTQDQHSANSHYDRPAHLGPASALDCYADLIEMGYVGEAREFALAITR